MKTVESGILLKKLNYSETSLILQFFTLESGFQAYIFQGGKRKHKKGNILQALSIVEISAYRRKDSDLGKVSEVNALFVPKSLPFHPLKSGLAFFMTEVLSQVLQNSDKDVSMYHFIEHEVQWIDESDEFTNYPIWFLLKLANQIGIGINVEDQNGQIFDLQDGVISNRTPSSHLYANDEVVEILKILLNLKKTQVLAYTIHKTHRTTIIEHLVNYFKIHINGFKTPKSMSVMQTIFE
ncbi:DNA repair protein RecO [Brumimicrobium salinarum]|uniref:DNA repair protein RecO n=1 Tax=Brumimicrobium salinarum TaxID=2058658 RepID=A0A2I0R5Q5_9FLAO|nr:DNA repair protein RecO [Brumimicrobium salinarum]PKR81914.1 DNA repair protein RecO [Brumimicrobium salinarum]